MADRAHYAQSWATYGFGVVIIVMALLNYGVFSSTEILLPAATVTNFPVNHGSLEDIDLSWYGLSLLTPTNDRTAVLSWARYSHGARDGAFAKAEFAANCALLASMLGWGFSFGGGTSRLYLVAFMFFSASGLFLIINWQACQEFANQISQPEWPGRERRQAAEITADSEVEPNYALVIVIIAFFVPSMILQAVFYKRDDGSYPYYRLIDNSKAGF